MGIAALFISLAVLIVLSGPARLLKFGKALTDTLRAMRRGDRSNSHEAAAGE
ncbi:MAG: hypothetical protein RLZZ387_4550 [Chloroflexota bacterium]